MLTPSNKFYFIKGIHGETFTESIELTNSEILEAGERTIEVIPDSDIISGIPNIIWKKGILVNSFGMPGSADRSNYINHNGNVYVCLSNNDNNLSNVVVGSQFPPTHTVGRERYGDGVEWEYLYSTTSSVDKYTGSFLPIPSKSEMKNLVDITEALTTSLCVGGETLGTCAVYQKPVIVNNDSYTAIRLVDLSIIGVSCASCSLLAQEIFKTDRLLVKFFPTNTTIPSNITIDNYATKLDTLISEKKINSKVDFQAKAYIAAKNSSISPGGILQTFINLDNIRGVSLAYLIVPDGITLGFDGDGEGCIGSFITTPNFNGTSTIIGINGKGGSGYSSPPTPVITGSLSTAQRNAILDNIDVINSIISNNVFDNISSMYDIPSNGSIGYQKTTNLINVSMNTNVGNINFYGLVPAAANIKSTKLEELLPNTVKVFPITSKISLPNTRINSIIFAISTTTPQ